MKKKETKLSRREFINSAAAGIAAFTIVPRHVLGGTGYTPPSEKLNIAGVGVGGQGGYDLRMLESENIIALCDVDDERAAETFEKHPNAKRYKDYRVMLEKEKDIEGVVVSTPDHTHAVIAMAAIKMGKHVYCQKPLTHNIYETRMLTEAARKHKVVTQMGTQIHATEALRLCVEIIKSGIIGNVREVHLWSRKFWGGGTRPKEMPPVPATLDWDLWLGPAPLRPYHPAYVPFHWRKWCDFGTGTLGDMACHIIDTAFWALDLDSPKTVEARFTEFNKETYPRSAAVRYEFDARGKLPPVTVNWYNGYWMPFSPKELEIGRTIPRSGGIYIGDKGTLLFPHGGGPRLIPESSMKDFKAPAPFLRRDLDHYQEWAKACKGGPKPLSNFDYAGPLTEMVLLGNIAMQMDKKLCWDAPNMQITNAPKANQYLQREYRQGWSL